MNNKIRIARIYLKGKYGLLKRVHRQRIVDFYNSLPLIKRINMLAVLIDRDFDYPSAWMKTGRVTPESSNDQPTDKTR